MWKYALPVEYNRLFGTQSLHSSKMSVLDLGLTMGITKDSERVPRRDELDTVSTPRSGQQATLLNLGRCLAAQHISREHACQAGASQW